MDKELIYNKTFDEKNRLICEILNDSKIVKNYTQNDLLKEIVETSLKDNKIKYHVQYKYNEYNNIIEENIYKNVSNIEVNKKIINDYHPLFKDKIIQITKIIDDRILIEKNEYNDNGLIIKSENNEELKKFKYDLNNNLIEIKTFDIVDNKKNIYLEEYFKYDENNKLIEETIRKINKPTIIKNLYTYENNFNTIIKTIMVINILDDLLESVNVEKTVNNDNNQLLERYYNDDLKIKKEYNKSGLLIYNYNESFEIEDKMLYDEYNNLIEMSDLMNDKIIKYEYDSHNNLLEEKHFFKSIEYNIKYNNEYKIEEKELFNYFDFDNDNNIDFDR